MNRYRRPAPFLLLGLLIASFPVAVQAGTVAEAVPGAFRVLTPNLEDGLSSEEVITLALQRNPGLRAMRKAHEAATAGIVTARELSSPELRLGWSDLNDGNVLFGNSRFDMTARWSPPRPGEKKWKTAWAKGNVSEIEGDLGALEQRLVADLLFLHTRICFLERQTDLAEDGVQVHQELVDLVREQIQAEVKGLPDLDKAELGLAEAKLRPNSYRMERTLCARRLVRELNLLPLTDIKVQTGENLLVFRPRAIDLAAWMEKAYRRRPELVSAAGQVAQADSLLGLEKIRRYPWLSFLQVGKQFADSSSSGTWGFRFGIDLPIFKSGKSNLRPLTAEVERRKLEQENWKQKIGVEIEDLVLQLQARYLQAEHFIRETDPALQKEWDHSRQAAAVGDTDPVPFLEARLRRIEKQQDYLANLLECRRLEIEVDRATGTIIDP